jgi:hypothetical protein
MIHTQYSELASEYSRRLARTSSSISKAAKFASDCVRKAFH